MESAAGRELVCLHLQERRSSLGAKSSLIGEVLLPIHAVFSWRWFGPLQGRSLAHFVARAAVGVKAGTCLPNKAQNTNFGITPSKKI